jgi:hypothetical protein
MPQKHNDINHGVDPELIRRYLAGELDDKAMHLLEKQALDDPFLADALEGYASYAPDQQVHLADLEKRLEQRVSRKSRIVPLVLRWSAAAAVLLLAAVGLRMLWQTPAPVKKDIVKVQEPTPDTVAPSAVMDEVGPVAADIPKPLAKRQAAEKKEDRAVFKSQNADVAAAEEEAPAVAMASVPAPAPGVALRKAKEKDDNKAFFADSVSTAWGIARSKKRTIKGKVTLFSSAEPLPGAQIVLAGTTTGTITDPNGNFTIQADTGNALLKVAMIGYESDKFIVASNENNVKIGLKESSASLQEVVVTENNRREYAAPGPQGGEQAFKEYLEENVHRPAAVKGKVKVSFVVKSDGTLEDFKIIKKLHPDCDKEAIRVIMDGPKWKPASDGKDTRVKVTVRF